MVNERIIRISDLFWFVISKWKLLILFAVIGALVCGGYKMVTNNKNISEKKDTAVTTSEPSADSLSSYDRQAAEVFLQYYALSRKQSEYIESSELMQIDPYHAGESGISFAVICEEEEETGAVLEAYCALLSGLEGEYGELVSFSTESGYSGDSSVLPEETVSVTPFASRSGLIRIKAFGTDTASSAEKIEKIRAEILGAYNNISDSDGIHTLAEAGSYTTTVNSQELILLQKKAEDTLYSMTTSMNNIQKTLSDEALDYIEKTIAYRNSSMDEPVKQTTEKKSGVRGKKAAIKAAVLGAVAAFLLAAILLALYYVFSGKLRAEDDVAALFMSPRLGITGRNRRKKNALDRAISDKRLKIRGLAPESDEVIAANIHLRAKSAGAKQVYLTGSEFGEKEKQFAAVLRELLLEKGLEATVGSQMMSDASAIEELGNVGCAVFIENADHALRSNIAGEIRYCRERSIKDLGIIVSL